MPRIELVAMAREDGSVNAHLEAWLRVRTTGGEEVECLVDTGFDGSLGILQRVVDLFPLEIHHC